jgi:AcrR family transcriptional regulator
LGVRTTRKPKSNSSPRRYTAEEARRRILDTAERRLLTSGPDAIRLQDIAGELGISHPAILHHFGSREALISALIARGYSRLIDELKAGWPSVKVPDLEGIAERFYRLAEKGYARLVAWVVLSGKNFPGFRPGVIKIVGEEFHAARQRADRRAGRPTPELEDSINAFVLLSLAIFGDALIGDLTRQAAGLSGSARSGQRFRAWMANVFDVYRLHGPRAGARPEIGPVSHLAERRKRRRSGSRR